MYYRTWRKCRMLRLGNNMMSRRNWLSSICGFFDAVKDYARVNMYEPEINKYNNKYRKGSFGYFETDVNKSGKKLADFYY